MRVLIWNDFPLLERKGGPSSYLFNLREGLSLNKETRVDFLSDKYPYLDNNSIEANIAHSNKADWRFKLKEYVSKYYFVRLLSLFVLSKKLKKDFLHDFECIDLDNYDYIHFHTTLSFFKARKLMERYKGRIVLTSHSPKVNHLELIEDCKHINVKHIPSLLYKKIEVYDTYSFEHSHFLLFPCSHAEEPYLNTWPKFKKITKDIKRIYVPTGIKPQFSKISRSTYRRNLNIPDDAFVISFAGRHNEQKGYDTLKKMGLILLNEFPNLYILVAGSEAPLTRVDHSRWIEVGWTDDPASLINSSDLFFLGNKDTYFDLVLLEVLSLDIPVVLSYTGGNKYFEKYNSSGIMFYSTFDDLLIIIKAFLMREVVYRKGDNINIFRTNFTIDVFAKKYLEIFNEL